MNADSRHIQIVDYEKILFKLIGSQKFLSQYGYGNKKINVNFPNFNLFFKNWGFCSQQGNLCESFLKVSNFNQGSKGIKLWLINLCTSQMMLH